MTPQDIAKLVTNGLIVGAVVLFVLFGGMPWATGLVVIAAVLVPSAAPAIANLARSALRNSSEPTEGDPRE